jgi:hypothetical protein
MKYRTDAKINTEKSFDLEIMEAPSSTIPTPRTDKKISSTHLLIQHEHLISLKRKLN